MNRKRVTRQNIIHKTESIATSVNPATMDSLPTEMYDQILTFVPIRDFMKCRLISLAFRESSTSYDRNICTHVPKHARWRRPFPNARLIQSTIQIQEEHFNDCIKLEKLTVQCPIVQDDAFSQLPDLHVLELWSSHWNRPRIRHVTTPMFRHLSQLHTLKVFSNHDLTDEALSYLPQLKRVVLDHCKQITSKGIQCLKQLVDLHLHSQSRITDEAFEGLPIQELYLNQNDLVTDQGILSLKHLQKLTTFKTPHLRGVGYKAMPQLTTLYLSGVTISSDYSDFNHVRFLILNRCSLPSEEYEQWASLHTIQIYNTRLAYPSALFKLSFVHQFTIEYCPCMVPYEAMLKKYFGEKVSCKHLQYLHPY